MAGGAGSITPGMQGLPLRMGKLENEMEINETVFMALVAFGFLALIFGVGALFADGLARYQCPHCGDRNPEHEWEDCAGEVDEHEPY